MRAALPVEFGLVADVRGGEIVAEGTPETVAKVEGSYTGQYLAPMLERQAEAAE